MPRVATNHMNTSKRVSEEFSSAKAAFIRVAAVSITAAVAALIDSLLLAESIGSFSRTVKYIGFVVLVTFSLIYSFVMVLKVRTTHASRLKQEVTGAFLKALDKSSFNPRRLEEKNEQPSAQTTG